MRQSSAPIWLSLAVLAALSQLVITFLGINNPGLQSFLLISLVVFFLIWFFSNKEVTNFSYSATPSKSSIFELKAHEYGIGYELLDVECEIRKNEVEVRRSLKVKAFSTIRQLDNFLHLKPDEGDHSEKRPPRVVPGSNETRGLEIVNPELQSNVLAITITPQLNPNEAVEYVLIEATRNSFFKLSILKEEYDRRMEVADHDFLGWRIDRPTRELNLKVIFPDNRKPSFHDYGVYFAPVAPLENSGMQFRREQAEQKRKVDAPIIHISTRGQCELVLRVNNPVVGLIYTLFWDPPIEDS